MSLKRAIPVSFLSQNIITKSGISSTYSVTFVSQKILTRLQCYDSVDLPLMFERCNLWKRNKKASRKNISRVASLTVCFLPLYQPVFSHYLKEKGEHDIIQQLLVKGFRIDLYPGWEVISSLQSMGPFQLTLPQLNLLAFLDLWHLVLNNISSWAQGMAWWHEDA